jgi:hypothetical protein
MTDLTQEQIALAGITIAKLKHSKFASEETHCFQCEVSVDGVVIGILKNDGHGGPDLLIGDNAYLREFDEWLAEAIPPWKSEYTDTTFPYDTSHIVCQLINEQLTRKAVTSAIKRGVCFIDPEREGVYSMVVRRGATKQAVLAASKAKRPQCQWLDDMPIEDAIEAYIANGGLS